MVNLNASDESIIADILSRGGSQAQEAWDLLIWWRVICTNDFGFKPCLLSRPFWLALDGEIPTGLGRLRRHLSDKQESDSVHLWLVRWMGAVGLLALWRTVRETAFAHKCHAN